MFKLTMTLAQDIWLYFSDLCAQELHRKGTVCFFLTFPFESNIGKVTNMKKEWEVLSEVSYCVKE